MKEGNEPVPFHFAFNKAKVGEAGQTDNFFIAKRKI
jgi:hypothetical protein